MTISEGTRMKRCSGKYCTHLRYYDQDVGLTGRLRTRVYAGSVTAIPVGADEIWRGSSLGRAAAASGCRDLCSHLRER